MRGRLRGFTLIELVVTISIIAILAAVALPRYIALQTQARTAKMQAIYGGIRSASMLAHAQAIATNSTAAATISMEGALIDQVTLSAGGAVAGSTITIDINGATTPANCAVSYTSALANASPTIVLPVAPDCS